MKNSFVLSLSAFLFCVMVSCSPSSGSTSSTPNSYANMSLQQLQLEQARLATLESDAIQTLEQAEERLDALRAGNPNDQAAIQAAENAVEQARTNRDRAQQISEAFNTDPNVARRLNPQ